MPGVALRVRGPSLSPPIREGAAGGGRWGTGWAIRKIGSDLWIK